MKKIVTKSEQQAIWLKRINYDFYDKKSIDLKTKMGNKSLRFNGIFYDIVVQI